MFENDGALQRLVEGPLRPRHVSAAVIAEIMLRKVMHMCQVSGCHLKGRKEGQRMKKEKKTWLAWHFSTLQDGQNSVEWQRVLLGQRRQFHEPGKQTWVPVWNVHPANLSLTGKHKPPQWPLTLMHIEAQKPVRLVRHLKKQLFWSLVCFCWPQSYWWCLKLSN